MFEEPDELPEASLPGLRSDSVVRCRARRNLVFLGVHGIPDLSEPRRSPAARDGHQLLFGRRSNVCVSAATADDGTGRRRLQTLLGRHC